MTSVYVKVKIPWLPNSLKGPLYTFNLDTMTGQDIFSVSQGIHKQRIGNLVAM